MVEGGRKLGNCLVFGHGVFVCLFVCVCVLLRNLYIFLGEGISSTKNRFEMANQAFKSNDHTSAIQHSYGFFPFSLGNTFTDVRYSIAILHFLRVAVINF